MSLRWIVVLVGAALLAVGCARAVAGTAAPDPDETRQCSYLGPHVGVTEVLAPCAEGARFAQKMRELGYPDNTTYMPSVSADTCQRKAAGLPQMSWSRSASDLALHRAFREAEIFARCPW